MMSATRLMFWVFAFEQPRFSETELKRNSFWNPKICNVFCELFWKMVGRFWA